MKKIGIIVMLSTLCIMSSFASRSSDIKVDTFDTTPVTLSTCETVVGSGMAEFDLTTAESQLVVILPNMAINWYVDAALIMSIPDPTAYQSSSSTVFAQVISTLDTVCKTIEEVTLIVLSAPDLSYLESIQDTFCGRPTVQLGTSPGPAAIYQWVPATNLDTATLANPIFTPDPAMDEYTYTVTATSLDSMCQSTFEVNFTVLTAELSIEGMDIIELCQGDAEITLTANTSESPENIMWSSSRDTLSDLSGLTTTIDAEQSTFVYVEQLFANGCLMRDTVLLRVDSLPNFEISVIPNPMEPCQKYCPGTTVTLITNAVDLPCFPDIEYEWMPSSASGGDIVEATDPNETPSDMRLNIALLLSNDNTRLYQRMTSNHACVEIDTHTIRVVDTIIDINGLPTDRICRGDQFTLMIDSSDWVNLTEVEWMVSDEEAVTLSCENCQSPVVTIADNAAPSTVSISVTGIAELCCDASGSVSVRIVVPDVPVPDITVCVGGSGQLMGDLTFTDYQWTNVVGMNLDPDNVSNPTVSNIQPGGGSAMVSAIAPDGCPSEGGVTVTAFFADGPDVSAPSTCAGGNSTIINNNSAGYTAYNWTINSGSGNINDANSPAPTISNIGSSDVSLQVSATDLNGCSTIRNINIEVDNETPPVIEPSMVCPGSDVVIELPSGYENFVFTDDDTAGVQFSISGTMLTISDTPDSNFTSFTVSFTVNETGDDCLVSGSFDVILLSPMVCGLYFPNAFAPSDTERPVNRTFQPLEFKLGNPIPAERINNFVIYNRWGQKVYDNDSNDTGWDGRQDGELAPSDVYLYIANITLADGTEVPRSGDVTLIR